MISRARLQIVNIVKSASLLDRSRIQIRSLEWKEPGQRYFCGGGKDSLSGKMGLEYHICRLRQCFDCLSPWYILHKIGVPRGSVIKFRRQLIRYSYPWIVYCLPIAYVMMAGDILAQLMYDKIKLDGTTRNYDILSTIKYGLIGFFLVGPLLSKWDLYLYSKMMCMKRSKYLMAKLLMDSIIMAPLLIALIMTVYDTKYLSENYQHLDRIRCKFTTPLTNIFLVNLMTRPLMMMAICLVPQCIRRQVRGLYEILLMIYLSRMLRCYYFGLSSKEIRSIQIEQRKNKGQHTGFCETVRKVIGCMCPKKQN